MTDVIFCFDTEDFTSSYAANAVRELADILHSEGIRGNFCLVGLFAEQLKSWGRQDVLDALKNHEIQFHSHGHTLHPLINEYTDVEDYGEAYRRLAALETVGLRAVKEITGTEKIYAAVPPGNSKSYAAMYFYADLGIPAYCDTIIDSPEGNGLYFCNALHLDYQCSLESVFYESGPAAEEVVERFSKRKRAIIYTHPNRVLYKTFWDVVNYEKRNLRNFGDWIEAERESKERAELYYSGLRDLIKRFKAAGFNFKTIGEIVEEENEKEKRIVTREMIPEILASLEKKLYYVESPVCLSVSEIFQAAVCFLRGENFFVPSKSYGFLAEPRGITSEITLSAGDIIEAAKAVNTESFLPECLQVGTEMIGAADFLFAALRLLASGKDRISLEPREQNMNLDAFPKLRDLSFKGTWMHSDDFEDIYLSKRLRLQAWTIRPASYSSGT